MYEDNCENYCDNNRQPETASSKRARMSTVDSDLETLDRELCAIDIPLVDPEITQGAEQLEQALVSRKRKMSDAAAAQSCEEDNDRLVREALSQFYLPSTRLLSAIDDCPSCPGLLSSSSSPSPDKRLKLDLNQNSKELDVVMDALRLGTTNYCGGTDLLMGGAQATDNFTMNFHSKNVLGGGGSSSSNCSSNNFNIDTCGQAAMIDASGILHSFGVVAPLGI